MKSEKRVVFEQKEIAGVTLMNVPIEDLYFDTYQRESKNLDKLRNNWIPVLGNMPILVSFRDGKHWGIDGRHRTTIRKERGETHILAMVYDGLTKDDEAKIFAAQDKAIVKISCFEKFHADYSKDTPEVYAKNLKAVLDKYNMSVEKEAGKLCIGGREGVIKDAIAYPDCEAIDFVLSLYKDLKWLNRNEKNCLEEAIINSFMVAYHKFGNESHNLSKVLMNALQGTEARAYKEHVLYTYRGYEKRKAFIKSAKDIWNRTK